MNTSPPRTFVPAGLVPAALLFLAAATTHAALPIWEAFNDHSPGDLTGANATRYELRLTGSGGPLRNWGDGELSRVTVTVEATGAPDAFGARGGAPATGSPAHTLFDGKVDLSNPGIPGVRTTARITMVFTGLEPTRLYRFCGFSSRGGGYNNRWSIYTIDGVENFVSAHQDASANKNIFTAATYANAVIDPNQVVLNAGGNKEGSIVCWDKIKPAADGTMRIDAIRYTGATPFGNAADGGTSYSYGFEAIYLAEFGSTGDITITEDPQNQRVAAGRTATFSVAASSPDPISYQWQMAPAGSDVFADIPGARSASYTTPELTVADDGTKYHCLLSSAGFDAVSGDASVSVDGTIPSITAARGSVNFKSVYVTFSEPMNLEQLVNLDAYLISGGGGLIIYSAVALDSTTVRLVTSDQDPGEAYTVTVNDIADIAGNVIPVDSSMAFNAYTDTPGIVGVEIWKNIGGGAITDLRGNARYPADYDVDFTIDRMDSLLGIPAVPDLNTYGGRMRAWLVPEETAEYQFFLRGDDNAEVRINLAGESFDELEDPLLNPTPIATATGGAAFQETGASVSAPLLLDQGVRYAIQVIWKESNGADLAQLAWRQTTDTTPAAELQPIPSRFFSYYGTPSTAPVVHGVRFEAGQVIITWDGAALESSEDLVNWAVEAGAGKPFVTPASGVRKFYRSRN